MIYPMKAQMLKEIDDEINGLMNGTTCASRFVRVLCSNRIQYLRWKSARIQKDLDTEPEHMPKCLGHPKWKTWPA